MNNKKRIYISLPISGYDIGERRAAAQKVEDMLLANGWGTVVNPLKNGLPADAGTHAHMKRDFELLLQCDAVYFMERWLHSKGCAVEFQVATAVGIEVYFEECFSLQGSVKFK